MRPVREITAKEENFRTERLYGTSYDVIKRDPIQPEPIGTIVLKAFRITGYDRDCDGEMLARMECIDNKLRETGWEVNCMGLYPRTTIVVTEKEWVDMFTQNKKENT